MLLLSENNFMLNYKWHHFHSHVVSTMCGFPFSTVNLFS